MPKQRKHRLVVEVTMSHPMTEERAAKGLQLVLDERLDLQAAPVWASLPKVYVDKLTVKQLSRVLAAQRKE